MSNPEPPPTPNTGPPAAAYAPPASSDVTTAQPNITPPSQNVTRGASILHHSPAVPASMGFVLQTRMEPQPAPTKIGMRTTKRGATYFPASARACFHNL